jgi:hypothetical protein
LVLALVSDEVNSYIAARFRCLASLLLVTD